jgi:hypothetical protein
MCLQVHGSREAAAAAREPLRWRHMLELMLDAARRPLLWLLMLVGFLWGEATLVGTACAVLVCGKYMCGVLWRLPWVMQAVALRQQ